MNNQGLSDSESAKRVSALEWCDQAGLSPLGLLVSRMESVV